jgi:hypothetical protein
MQGERSVGVGVPSAVLTFPSLNLFDSNYSGLGKEKRVQQELGERFLQSLLDCKLEDCGEEIKLMKNIGNLEVGGIDKLIVIRNIVEKFWKACIQKCDSGIYRVCAVGTPGVGKTVTAPLLIRMLLQAGATILYRIAGLHYNAGWLYEFVPSRLSSPGKYACFVYPDNMGNLGEIASLCLKSSYYIVDTGDSEISYNPSVAFRPKVVIVATPDERHFGSGFLKMRASVCVIPCY